MHAFGHTARAVLSITAAALLAACSGFGFAGRAGEGAVVSETRAVAPFTMVETTNGIRVVIRIDPAVKIGATQPVEVRAQSNLVPIIATESANGTLTIRATESYRTSEAVEVSIVTSALAGVTLSGGSRAEIGELDEDDFAVRLTGGSVVAAAGKAAALDVQSSGGSRAELDELVADTVTLDVGGGSVADVHATGTVTGAASGGSRVTVGGGAHVAVTSTGGSTVTIR